jgi:Fe-S-cluster-containing dehydrogenase component
VRQEKGHYPACVEACPVGARKFGNLLDEQSEIRHILREKRVFILKEDLSTEPKFYYFYAT